MINIFVPQDTTSLALGSDEIASLLIESMSSRGLDVKLIRNGSRGMFWLEPLLEIEFEGDRFGFGPITMSDVPSIIDVLEDSHSDLKNIAHPLFLGRVENIEYLAKQQRLTFKRSGLSDPTCINSYQSLAGFKGLTKALSIDSQLIVDELKNSGLRLSLIHI